MGRSGQAIGYSEKWQYFEKDISSRKKPAWLEKHDKENELKDKLKKDYMNDIDRVRSKEKKDRTVERKRKLDIEVQVKKDGREAEEASKHAKIVEDKSEKDKKTADKVKSSNMQFEMRMEVTTSQIDELEKDSLERVNKRLVDEKDSAAIAQLKADKKQV